MGLILSAIGVDAGGARESVQPLGVESRMAARSAAMATSRFPTRREVAAGTNGGRRRKIAIFGKGRTTHQ